MRLAPAVQKKSPPSESAGRVRQGVKDKRRRESVHVLPSRGPRLFARNIRRFIGPPSWKRSESVGADVLLSGCRTPARAPSERSCGRGR